MEVKGREWTIESKILAALAMRFGGEVTVSDEEMERAAGMVIFPERGGVRVKAAATSDEPVSANDGDRDACGEMNLIGIILFVMIVGWSLAIYGIWSLVKLIFG